MRWLLRAAVLAGVLAAFVVIVAAYVLSGIVAAVFLDGADLLASVHGPLVVLRRPRRASGSAGLGQ